jgi:two-component system, response regulator RegA
MPARILVVDDDLSYLTVTKDLLESGGHQVLLASTFEEGRRALRENTPDLLIADVRLGAFNGLQLIATGHARIPSIVISGFDDSVLQAEAHAFGADYLVKPVTGASLLDLIEHKLAGLIEPKLPGAPAGVQSLERH